MINGTIYDSPLQKVPKDSGPTMRELRVRAKEGHCSGSIPMAGKYALRLLIVIAILIFITIDATLLPPKRNPLVK
jgi:hypothetical protein